MGARIVCGTLITVLALAVLVADARATDRPMVEAVVDHDSGAELWSSTNPTAVATLKPGQEILLKGRNLGPGPITAARPGLGPPAGGVPPGDGTSSVTSSPPAATPNLQIIGSVPHSPFYSVDDLGMRMSLQD